MGIHPNQKRALYYGYEAYIKEIDKVPLTCMVEKLHIHKYKV